MAKCNWGIHIPMYSPFVMYRHVCLYTYRTTHHSISYETTTPGKYDSTKLSRRETWLCLWTSRFSFGSSTSHIFECVSPTYLSQRRFFKTFPARDESCEHDSFEHAAWKCQGHISWRRFLFLTYVCFTFLLSLSATKKTRITLIKEFELVTSWCLIAVCNLQCRTSTPSMVWKKSTWQRHDSLEKDNFNRKACVIDEATCIDNLDLKKTSGTWIKRGNACTQPSASRKGCSKMFGCVIGKKARG